VRMKENLLTHEAIGIRTRELAFGRRRIPSPRDCPKSGSSHMRITRKAKTISRPGFSRIGVRGRIARDARCRCASSLRLRRSFAGSSGLFSDEWSRAS
jgi:hypothetical protein